MDPVLEFLIPYLLNLAAGLHSGKMLEKEQKKLEQEQQALKEKLAHEAAAGQAVLDRLSLKDQLRLVGTEAARRASAAGFSPAEKQMLMLLSDEVFQADIARWLTAWRPKEKKNAEAGLAGQMIKALQKGGVEERFLHHFTARYFNLIEKQVFSDPVLANWRLALALQAAFERLEELEAIIRQEGRDTRQEVRVQHEVTRLEVKEIASQQAGLQIQRFSAEQRLRAEQRYRDLALESCDIMDLHNLPEGDRHLAARHQELKLRRLYVPLRVRVEFSADRDPEVQDLEKIEKQRDEWHRSRIEGRGKRISGSAKQDEEDDKNRVPVGERLEKAGRMVLLGDPGAGKTTLLRWIATAYLLRLKEDPAWKELPDVATLPGKDWLPIVVRCRDLGDSCKTGSIYDVLCETFRKAQLSDDESAALQAVIIEKLAVGQAILLVDGLDEIGNIGIRARFCQQIERLQTAFPLAPMMVTSRIVGYREMNYRIGRGFEHATVTGFSKKDKDEFARRWCEITELPERAANATKELTGAIHSSDRIERLAVNPMLLTTLALVKRKVGKLPERRADLYWEAVLVLLNWRSEVDEPMDHREAIPQLQYVAYEMCRLGVQRLREEEILELLERIREEYPNVRDLKKHEPREFLRLLERRTGILLEVGEVPYKGMQSPVFEFRHLTFQEYLAALALVHGRFPGRDKTKSLAQHIAPLAGETGEYRGEAVVKDNWREVLRLVVACCGDDDVDKVLLAILTPLPGEEAENTARARAVLALSCLADEPNLSDAVAQQIIQAFTRQVKKNDGMGFNTTIDFAALELVGLVWDPLLRAELIREFCQREPLLRWNPGSLCAMMGLAAATKEEKEFHQWQLEQVNRLTSGDETEAIEAALVIMKMAYENRGEVVNGMVEGLMALLDKNGPSAHAGAWALAWLAKSPPWDLTVTKERTWIPNQKETDRLITFISNSSSDIEAVHWICGILSGSKSTLSTDALILRINDTRGRIQDAAFYALRKIKDPRAVEPIIKIMVDENENIELRTAAIEALGNIGDPRAVEPLLKRLTDENARVRTAAIRALGNIGDPRAKEPLIQRLADENADVRKAALAALAKMGEEETDRKLLTSDLDGGWPWLDPKKPVEEKRIKKAARKLKLSAEEIKQRYERLAEKYGLRLGWKVK